MSAASLPPRSLKLRVFLAVLALICAAGCIALSYWQVERREWKHALIAAVDERVAMAPVSAPSRPDWARLTAERDAYRRVNASGTFSPQHTVLVKAVTDLGGGYWVMTPLVTPSFTVWVNRGYVPSVKELDRQDNAAMLAPVTVTGLLRTTEPGGGFLRKNDPAQDRWFSRDVAAMSAATGISEAAPYFIDAEASSAGSYAANPPTMGPAVAQPYPVGGLTVITFSDNHLVYAITWFVLALLLAGGAWLVLADGRIRRDKP